MGAVYKLDRDYLDIMEESQMKLFKEEFSFDKEKFIELEFNKKGYSINGNGVEVSSSKIQAISVFSGAGGLDIGAQLAGVKVISSLDFDRDSVATLNANRYFNHTNHQFQDISEVSANDYTSIIKKNKPNKLILIGGPPCQPFSKAGYWVTHKNRLGSEDPRNMIGQYLRLIDDIRPDGFILENVESIMHPQNISTIHELGESIDLLGYNFMIYKANAIDFGVPQKRKRVFIFASKNEFNSVPIKTHGTEKEVLVNPKLNLHERVIDWIGQYDDPKYHEPQELTNGKTYHEELLSVPPGKNYIALTAHAGYPNPKFIAHKRFWSFLLKLHPYKPSWTIAAQPGPWVGPFHWTNRRLRVPEISAIQTFPADYKFIGTRRSIQKQIGNAVPPLLGKSMIEHLNKYI
jgi:DNA (cytosine-5)-methyltransferase 1